LQANDLRVGEPAALNLPLNDVGPESATPEAERSCALIRTDLAPLARFALFGHHAQNLRAIGFGVNPQFFSVHGAGGTFEIASSLRRLVAIDERLEAILGRASR